MHEAKVHHQGFSSLSWNQQKDLVANESKPHDMDLDGGAKSVFGKSRDMV